MKKIYAIRDRVADELVGMRMYCLMVFRTDEEAARYFADAINDTTSILNKHPADYELIELGQLDDQYISGDHSNRVVITGDTLLALQQPPKVD